jgi:hypothetical protein
MSDFNNFNDTFNGQPPSVIEPTILIDQLSGAEIFIGTSINGKDTSAAIWKIKKIMLDGTVWNFQFPNGDQSYSFVWDDRISGYTYE